LTRLRKYETKLGERIRSLSSSTSFEQELSRSDLSYVVFGIAEDIGVIANGGRGGADSLWYDFLTEFLNIQSNDFVSGDNILLAGYFDFSDLKKVIDSHAPSEQERMNACRHAVTQIDEEVENLVKLVCSYQKIPVAIGGGHNNAYPMIKGAAKGLHKADLIPIPQINCVNLDAHTDYRPSEGRHSGNSFRYAEEDGFLQKYCVIGVHENYLPQNVWIDIVNNPFIDLISFEDIFIHCKRNFRQAIAHAAGFTDDNYTGIELDLDAVEDVLSSASSPSGVSSSQARQYVNFMATDSKPAYLHICEGATRMVDGREDASAAKLVSYLVTDFIKGQA
jgi:formiminoglutamase